MLTYDEATIEHAIAGNEHAVRALLHASRHDLHAYIVAMLPAELIPQYDPEDILNDTFFNAVRSIETLNTFDPAAFKKWLKTIARHRMVDLLRQVRAAKRRRVRLGEDGPIIEMVKALAVDPRTPSRSVMLREWVGIVSQALLQLPEAYQTALRWRYIDDVAPIEIARRMQRSEHAIHQLCNRALKALREKLRSASHYF